MIAVTGRRTSIVAALEKLTAEEIVRIPGNLASPTCPLDETIPFLCTNYVLAAGLLHPKQILSQNWREIIESLSINLVNVIRLCEFILEKNCDARICIIGSESARLGSFDQTYAAAKAGVHAYVQARKILPTQRLACIEAPIIADAGMTLRRKDYPEILKKRPHVYSRDVALTIWAILSSEMLQHWERGLVLPVMIECSNCASAGKFRPRGCDEEIRCLQCGGTGRCGFKGQVSS